MRFVIVLYLLGLAASAPAQLVFSTGQSGVDSAVFQQLAPGGAVTRVNTGFVHSNYASVSRDGRFITFSSPDPTDPVSQVLPSSDIYRFDRVTGQWTRLFNYQTIVQNIPGDPRVKVGTFLPEYNALSPDGRFLVASVRLSTRLGNIDEGYANNLSIVVISGGDGVIEAGRGSLHDFLHAEFVGISWAPDSRSFVTPAYITLAPGNNSIPPVVGIVRYSLNNQNVFVRSQILSQPTLGLSGLGSGTIQIFPALSPSGAGLAYWDISFPDAALLTKPATARLIVANSDGSGASVRATYAAGNNNGFYPLGLTWSADGNQLIYSIANQLQGGGGFPAAANAGSAVIRSVASSGSNIISQLPGINGGYMPSLPMTGGGSGPGPDPINLADIPLIIRPSGDNFILSASGLDPNANYILESGISLKSFTNPVIFKGSQIMGGIPVTKGGSRAFFRLRNP
jgi:hypothetical protein